MKELRIPALAMAVVLLVGTATSALPPRGCPQCDMLSDVTKKIVALMNEGRFPAAVERFDDRLKQELPAEKLERTWTDLSPKLGAFKRIVAVRTTERNGSFVSVATCAFEKGEIDVRLVYGASERIAEMSIVPAGSKG